MTPPRWLLTPAVDTLELLGHLTDAVTTWRATRHGRRGQLGPTREVVNKLGDVTCACGAQIPITFDPETVQILTLPGPRIIASWEADAHDLWMHQITNHEVNQK